MKSKLDHPLLPPQLLAHGIPLDLDPRKLGFLRASYAESNIPTLRHQMNEDGYLYIKDFWDRAQVQKVRDSITTQLSKLGFLRPGTPCDAACFDGREVGRAMGNPLNQKEQNLYQMSRVTMPLND